MLLHVLTGCSLQVLALAPDCPNPRLFSASFTAHCGCIAAAASAAPDAPPVTAPLVMALGGRRLQDIWLPCGPVSTQRQNFEGVLAGPYTSIWRHDNCGFLYAVMNCGGPMEARACPECGNGNIGGLSHVPAPGNTFIYGRAYGRGEIRDLGAARNNLAVDPPGLHTQRPGDTIGSVMGGSRAVNGATAALLHAAVSGVIAFGRCIGRQADGEPRAGIHILPALEALGRTAGVLNLEGQLDIGHAGLRTLLSRCGAVVACDGTREARDRYETEVQGAMAPFNAGPAAATNTFVQSVTADDRGAEAGLGVLPALADELAEREWVGAGAAPAPDATGRSLTAVLADMPRPWTLASRELLLPDQFRAGARVPLEVSELLRIELDVHGPRFPVLRVINAAAMGANMLYGVASLLKPLLRWSRTVYARVNNRVSLQDACYR